MFCGVKGRERARWAVFLDAMGASRYNPSMTEELRAKIAERRTRLADIQNELVILRAELRAYEDALTMVEARRQTTAGGSNRRVRTRRPSEDWAAVFSSLSLTHPHGFTIDDILAVAAGQDFATTRGNVRSQAAAYINRELLERLNEGTFRLTEAGTREFCAAATVNPPTNQSEGLEEQAAAPEEGAAA
jgi:hypothetical protein